MSRLGVALRNIPLLLRGIWEYNVGSRFGPLPAREWLFPVTYRCNARCIMCNIWQTEPTPELDVDQWERCLDDALFAGIESVNLTGGEPTLRSDLPELADLLTCRLPSLRRLTLTTNALAPDRVVSQCRQLQALCERRRVQFFVGISLDGIGDTHDRMRSVPGAFARVQETLRGLQEQGGGTSGIRSGPAPQSDTPSSGLRLGVNCTLTSRNMQDAENVRRWCTERGLPVNFIIASFADHYYANLAAADELSLGPQSGTATDAVSHTSHRQALIDFLDHLATESPLSNPAVYFYADAQRMISARAPRSTPCVFQKSAFTLDGRGDLQYCMYSRVLGNVQHQAASAMYYAPQNLEHREEVIASRCRDCTITCFLEVGLAKDAFRYLRFALRRNR